MPKTWIIIPCYNEQFRLPIKELGVFFENSKFDVSILFVNDGSNDNTLSVLQTIHDKYPEKSEILDLQTNNGKANAIRVAAMYLTETQDADYLGYWDADLSTPIIDVCTFLNFLYDHNEFKFILGSRIKRLGSCIERGFCRHFLGRIFATASSMVLNIPVYDTQCGAKIFSAELSTILFKDSFCSSWFFDVELLARYICSQGYTSGLHTIYEFPLSSWKDLGGSKLKFKDFLRAPLDLMRIRLRYYKKLTSAKCK